MKTLITFVVLQICLMTYSQERLEIKSLGFSMDIPNNWNSFSDSEIIKNLEEYDFSNKQMDYFIKSRNKVVSIATFTKYDPNKYFGIIPTIKVTMRHNTTLETKDFLNYVKLMNDGAKKQLDEFVIVKQPVLEIISGHDVVNSSYEFKLKRGNDNYFIKTNTYYILRGSYFLTVNFIEEINKENNEGLFGELIKSIKLNKL